MGEEVAEAAQIHHVFRQPAAAVEPDRDVERAACREPGCVLQQPVCLDERRAVHERVRADHTRGERLEASGRQATDEPLGEDRETLLQILIARESVAELAEGLGAAVVVRQHVRPHFVREECRDAARRNAGSAPDQELPLRDHQTRRDVLADFEAGPEAVELGAVVVELGARRRRKRRRPDDLAAGRLLRRHRRNHVVREGDKVGVGLAVDTQAPRQELRRLDVEDHPYLRLDLVASLPEQGADRHVFDLVERERKEVAPERVGVERERAVEEFGRALPVAVAELGPCLAGVHGGDLEQEAVLFRQLGQPPVGNLGGGLQAAPAERRSLWPPRRAGERFGGGVERRGEGVAEAVEDTRVVFPLARVQEDGVYGEAEDGDTLAP